MSATFDHPKALLEHVGQELGTSDWLVIDQKRINGFADDTEDHQWIHVDVERAKTSPFGSTIAHGYLTLSMAPAILQQVVQVENVTAALNYGLNKVRFPAPVPVDSRIRGTVTLAGASERGASVEAVFGITIEIEGGSRPACVAEMVVLYS
jgi:acyl dehydratase